MGTEHSSRHHEEYRCDAMAELDEELKSPGIVRTCCICDGHECHKGIIEETKELIDGVLIPVMQSHIHNALEMYLDKEYYGFEDVELSEIKFLIRIFKVTETITTGEENNDKRQRN